MTNKTNDEILKEAKESRDFIHNKILNKEYVSYGTLLRRDEDLISLTRADDLKKFKEIIILYFDGCMLKRKVPKKEELLQKLEEMFEGGKGE